MPPLTSSHWDAVPPPSGEPFLWMSVALMVPATSSLYGVPAAGALPIPTFPSGLMRIFSELSASWLVLMMRGWLLVVPRNLVGSMLLLPVITQVTVLLLLPQSATNHRLRELDGRRTITTKTAKQKTMNR